jgi:integrase
MTRETGRTIDNPSASNLPQQRFSPKPFLLEESTRVSAPRARSRNVPGTARPLRRRQWLVPRRRSVRREALGASVDDPWQTERFGPTKDLKLFKLSNERVAYVEADGFQRLVESCTKSKWWFLAPLVVVAAGTGFRKANVVNLEWCQIDFASRTISITKTKSRTPISIPMLGCCLRYSPSSTSNTWTFPIRLRLRRQRASSRTPCSIHLQGVDARRA